MNGRNLMELQKIRQQRKEESPSTIRKKGAGRKKTELKTTPSVNKPGDTLEYIGRKKALVEEENKDRN